jgi:hypothetical protein
MCLNIPVRRFIESDRKDSSAAKAVTKKVERSPSYIFPIAGREEKGLGFPVQEES